MTDEEQVGVNVGECRFQSVAESLKQRVAHAQAAVETAAKELADAQRALAEATAVAWVAAYSNSQEGHLDPEYVGFKTFPVSMEVELPWHVRAWLEEEFDELPVNPSWIDQSRFGKPVWMSSEIQCKNDQKPGYYRFVVALFRTKEEAEQSEPLLRKKHHVDQSGKYEIISL